MSDEHVDEPNLPYFGAYWGHREQTAEEVAEDVNRFLTRLAEVTPLTREAWTFWKRDPSTFDGLLRMVREGRNRYDAPPREVIKELGFQVSATLERAPAVSAIGSGTRPLWGRATTVPAG